MSEYVEHHYNQDAFLYRTSTLWPFKILSRNIGIFMESSRRSVLTAVIASTASGHVLVRNRHFLCHCVPISPPKYTGPGHPALVCPNPPAHAVFHLTPHPPQTSHRGDLIQVACVQAQRGGGGVGTWLIVL